MTQDLCNPMVTKIPCSAHLSVVQRYVRVYLYPVFRKAASTPPAEQTEVCRTSFVDSEPLVFCLLPCRALGWQDSCGGVISLTICLVCLAVRALPAPSLAAGLCWCVPLARSALWALLFPAHRWWAALPAHPGHAPPTHLAALGNSRLMRGHPQVLETDFIVRLNYRATP